MSGLLAGAIVFGDSLAKMDSPMVAYPNSPPRIGSEFWTLQESLFPKLPGFEFWSTAVGARAKGAKAKASLTVLARALGDSQVWEARYLSLVKYQALTYPGEV